MWQDAEDSEEKNIKRIRNIIKKIYVIAFQEFVLHKFLQFLKQGGGVATTRANCPQKRNNLLIRKQTNRPT